MRPVILTQTGAGSTAPVPLDQYLTPFEVSLAVILTGAATYTVEWTQDDIWNTNPSAWTWFPAAANLVGATDNETGTLTSPVAAVRLRQTAGGGSSKLIVRQSGVMA